MSGRTFEHQGELVTVDCDCCDATGVVTDEDGSRFVCDLCLGAGWPLDFWPDPVPCTVLDPFLGAGTVGLVAAKLGRDWIGVELNPEYAKLAQDRIDHGGDWKQVEQAHAGQTRLLEA